MSDNKILKRLEQLYALTKIRPEEEGDEARLNEARTASFLLLKTARENGVKVKFEVPKTVPVAKDNNRPPAFRPDAATGNWVSNPFYASNIGDTLNVFEQMMREAERQQRRQREEAARKLAEVRAKEHLRKNAEARAQEEQSRTGPATTTKNIKAKRGGICVVCGRSVLAGTRVYWRPRVGVAHELCGRAKLDRVGEFADTSDEYSGDPQAW